MDEAGPVDLPWASRPTGPLTMGGMPTPAVQPPYEAHTSAEIEHGAVIGNGTRIWHLTHVRTAAVIGDSCSIGRNVFVDSGVHVGDRCKIQNNVSVYRGVTLEDEVFVGPSAVFTNDLHPRAVGDWAVSETLVERGASIGAGAVIVCGVTIGTGALVAAGAVVTRDVAPRALVMGNPARVVGSVCEHGHRVDETKGAEQTCTHEEGRG